TKNALAFNYAPQERGTQNLYERANKNATKYRGNKYPSGKDIIEQSEEYYNCQVLACPELKNFSSMINDTRFDYYSLYANPPPPDNATCLPGMGMFIYYDKPENYSRAFNACQEINGSLAGVVSESQTNALSKLLKLKYNTTHQDMAFVDLREKEHNETTNQYTYHTSEGFPLECFAFRAWSPGFPRKFKHAACVTITKENSWKVVPCTKKKPFICEIFPTGPDRRISSTRKCSIKRPNNPSDKQNSERF
uniref:Putative c-type lectin n=1 Tax=Lutzomyia longipalpis TaxID=7200 RepID=A0A1B0CL12_LUTLO